MKLEILRMAREIVNNEYIDKRAQDHNKWLADSEKLATRGIKVPYPDIPPYPDESIVIAKAKSLLSFVGVENAEDVHPFPVKKVEERVEVKKQPEPQKVQVEKVEVEEVQEQKSSEQKPQPRSDEDLFREYVHRRVSFDSENEETSSSKMISMLLKQLDDLKRMRKV